ncbi:18769_t:CDS:2 [Funneliformis geosporum]|uniref:10482_t:CDS:1 n=1 Tax=Funneliformis geosporum TaxID=1117311 RepID=A0A9W4T475_9GLOM|nr:18769_t:CDS:2 [Funneliformis geosporum]CAI2191206.1 10482_t:CDS:2 [Funneliformis geosporum]
MPYLKGLNGSQKEERGDELFENIGTSIITYLYSENNSQATIIEYKQGNAQDNIKPTH